MNELQSVVVTGMGAITAHGDLTLRGDPTRHGAGDGAASEAGRPDSAGGRIESFKLERYLASQKTYLDRCSALALAGCALALTDAGVQWPPADTESADAESSGAESFGIALGTHLGCIETMKAFWDKTLQSGARGASPLLFSHSYFNSPISLCAIEFGLRGFHATFCAGPDSGLEAVRAARDAIRLGHAGAMLCGGVEALTPARALFEPAAASGAAASGEAASGAAASGEAVALGEAAVFFVLEEAGRAARRGAGVLRSLPDSLLEQAASHASTGARYGDCGGAQSVLALTEALWDSPDNIRPADG